MSRDPIFYGASHNEDAVGREARRLSILYNRAWCYHLSQDDVDALIAADRLWDFTHRVVPGEGWQPIDPPPAVTAAEVNEWAIRSFGHDSINCWVVVKAACKRDGYPYLCDHCNGHGNIATDAQREAAENVELYEPPVGAGWQLWETVSEGSPVSPVFTSAEALADWCAESGQQLGWEPATAEQWLTSFTNDTLDVDSMLIMYRESS